ncbi:MAG TPA: globin domain-containing protein [Streptosporangiaceae bacterium]|nr:globin domain-containing protein [Streptosporangiaceae bacterium]
MAIALSGFGGEPGDRVTFDGGAAGPVPLRSAAEGVTADSGRLLPAAGAVSSGNCPPAAQEAAEGAAAGPGGSCCGEERCAAETAAQVNSRLLRKSISQLEPESEHVMAYFFATLFLRNPELRPIFPLAMDTPRRRLFGALTRYVWSCDHPESLARWLSELARDHRKYGVTEAHYRPFCDALLTTIEAFSGRAWTPEMKTAWEGALSYIATIMTDAAHGAQEEPAWSLAEVTGHDPRRPDLAVLRIRPDAAEALSYRPGQHISIQVPRWPRVWREYSIANAPRPDGLLRLHVRAVPGGRVSTALVHQTRIGDTVLIGRARGDMTADAVTSPVVVCVAGGTGLAPVRAILEALASPGRPPPRPSIRLLVGARREEDLYDLPGLQQLTRAWPFLEVIPVVSDDPRYPGSRGTLPEVTPRYLPPGTGDVIISGPPAMVTATAEVVAARAPGARIHFDPPGPLLADQPRGSGPPPT